jgi:hypothetical protein
LLTVLQEVVSAVVELGLAVVGHGNGSQSGDGGKGERNDVDHFE